MINKVVAGGYCVGCGGCAVHSDAIQMQLDKYGQMIPVVDTSMPLSSEQEHNIANTCPFSGVGKNEDQIGQDLYGELAKDPEIGHFHSIYAGRVVAEDYYLNGSSGGIGKWILAKLLDTKEVDFVIQVTEVLPEQASNVAEHLHYQFQVFESADKIINGSKSAYYPVEMSEVLKFIKNHEGRFAITGVPCFIKTVRRLSHIDKVFAKKIAFTLSIVCGHLKTKGYAEMIAWQLGVMPEELAALDFRKKISGKKANQKGVQARNVEGQLSREDIVQNLFGTNYGHGLFKYSACDYCDDVVGETADVSVGDAWLPEFLNQGTSLVIIRNPLIARLIEKHATELSLSSISAKQAADSQRAGLRHRRDYLQYRLWLKQKAGKWFPEKRVQPSSTHLDAQKQRLVQARIDTAGMSHKRFFEAKQNKDFNGFKRVLLPGMELMHDLRLKPAAFWLVRALRVTGMYKILVKLKQALRKS